MAPAFADITLSNPLREELPPVDVKALADAGAVTLRIPQDMADQLQLEAKTVREVQAADGSIASVPYMGPIKVSFGNRGCYVGALVLGDEVLLGSIPLDDMDLIVNPSRREVTVDPASPDRPRARV